MKLTLKKQLEEMLQHEVMYACTRCQELMRQRNMLAEIILKEMEVEK